MGKQFIPRLLGALFTVFLILLSGPSVSSGRPA